MTDAAEAAEAVTGEEEWEQRKEGEELYSDEWWDRFARNMLRKQPHFGTVERVLDGYDPGWRRRRKRRADLARAAAAAAAAGRPGSRKGLGRIAGRTTRQVNVKLGEGDFEALQLLAAGQDLPPATLARMLLRDAIAHRLQAAGPNDRGG